MNHKIIKLFAILAALVFLTACGSAPATNWPSLSTDGASVYLSNGSHIYIVDVASGVEKTISTSSGSVAARIPQAAQSSMAFYAPVAFSSDKTLLVGNSATKSHNFFNFDPQTGNVLWSFDAAKNTWIAKALVAGDTVYAASGDGNLYIIDAKKGTAIGSPIQISEHQLWVQPVTDGKQVIVVNMEHQVISLGMDGKENWKQTLDTGVLSTPLLQDGTLYLGTLSGKLYAINAATGEIKWNNQLDGNIWGTPASDGTNLYIGTVIAKAGKFYSVALANGAINWSRDEEGSIIAGPTVSNGQILYGTEMGKLQSLGSDGTPKWQAVIENAHFYNTPLVVGDSVVMAPMNAEFMMVAYDLTGAQRWTFTGK